MTQAGTEPTSSARERIPLSAVIMAALLATMAFGGGIAIAWSEGWPIVGIASQLVAIPVGAASMYHVMARISTYHDLARAGRPQNPRAILWPIGGIGMGTMVVGAVVVGLQLINAGIGLAGGIMLGLFWWMVRQRSTPPPGTR